MALGDGSLQGLAAGLLQGYQLYRQNKLDKQNEEDRTFNRERTIRQDTLNEENVRQGMSIRGAAEERATEEFAAGAGERAYKSSPEYATNLRDKDVADVQGTKSRARLSEAQAATAEEELRPENVKLRQRGREADILAKTASARNAGLQGELLGLNIGEKKEQIKRDREFRAAADTSIKPYMQILEDSKVLLTNPDLIPAVTRAGSIIQKIQNGQPLNGDDNSFLSNPNNAGMIWQAKYGNSLTNKFKGKPISKEQAVDLTKNGVTVPEGSVMGTARFQRLMVDKNDGTIIPQMIIQYTRPDGAVGSFNSVISDGEGGFRAVAPVAAVGGDELEMSLSSMLTAAEAYTAHNIKTPEDVDRVKLASLAVLRDGQLTPKELDEVFGTNPEEVQLKDILDFIGLAKMSGYSDTPEAAQGRLKAATLWANKVYGDKIPPEVVEALNVTPTVKAGSAAATASKATAKPTVSDDRKAELDAKYGTQ